VRRNRRHELCNNMAVEMEILTEKQIVARIREGAPFTAATGGGGLRLCIRAYGPVMATAIHDGHRVAAPLAGRMQVTEADRLFEEDPHTGTLAEAMDISLRVVDSRYCCDLNRSEQRCLYDEAWGKQVWREPPGETDRQLLLSGHRRYYRILDALLGELVERFGAALLYDLHSYNYGRIDGSPPLFNIGTHYIDMQRFGPVVAHLMASLQAVAVPGIDNRAACDEVFQGRGYQAEFVHTSHPDVLCVPLELKKVYTDEAGAVVRDDVYGPLFAGTGRALKETGAFFAETLGLKRGC